MNNAMTMITLMGMVAQVIA